MKLLTPIARTLPSASSVSNALVRGDRPVEPVRGRLVEDEQVELVDTELAGRLVERVQRLVVAVVADPHLGLDEHRGPVEAGAADAIADLPLVAVRGSGVDVPVADASAPSRPLTWSPPAGSGTRRARVRAS